MVSRYFVDYQGSLSLLYSYWYLIHTLLSYQPLFLDTLRLTPTQEFGKETHINVSIIDEVRKKNDKPMGSAVFEIGDILGSRGSIKAKKLKKGGTLYARLQKAPPQSSGQLALCLRGIKLKNVEGLFKKSDPFYEFRRTYEGPGGGSWTPVYRSKQVKDNLNPKWEPATVDVNALCGGDLDRRLQVAIYDFESSGKHQSMGSFETTGESRLFVGSSVVSL